MYGWVGWKHAYVNLIVVFPPVRLRKVGFTMGQVDFKAASSKVVEHEKTCSDNQHVFVPFVFDTFDFLTLETVDRLHKVQRLMHNNNNVISPGSIDIIFEKIGFVI